MEILLADNLTKLERTRVVSNIDGKVYSVNRLAGEYMNSGDLIVILETSEPPYIIARFKFDEARLIQRDFVATIRMPSENIVFSGRVASIGHTGLMPSGDFSRSAEISLNEVPVRIVPDYIPDGLSIGSRVDVKIETGFHFGALGKVLWSGNASS